MLATSNSELCLMTSWFVASLPPPSGCNFHEKILFGSCWPVWFVSARLLAFRLKEKWWLTRLRSGKPTKRLPPLNDMQPAIGKGLPILVLRWPFFQRFFLGSLFRSRPKLRLQTGSSLPSRCQKSAQFPSFSSSSRSKNQSCCRCFTIFHVLCWLYVPTPPAVSLPTDALVTRLNSARVAPFAQCGHWLH